VLVCYHILNKKTNICVSAFLGAYDLHSNLGITRALIGDIGAIFTHSKYNIPLIRKMGVAIKNIHLVYRGINVSELNICDKQHLKKCGHIYVCVSRLTISKNVAKAINIFNCIKKIDPASKLIVIGMGDQLSNLRLLAEKLGIIDSIKFMGYVKSGAIFPKLLTYNAMLYFSIKESERLPNAIKEAMFAGNVIFSSNTPGIDELIEDGVNGYIIKDMSSNTRIADFIVKIMSKNDKRIICNAYNTIVRKFNVDLAMRKYIEIWRNIEKL